MTLNPKPILAIVLCAILALTGQSMAVARGASAATGQMVICSGSSTLVVYVDAEGEPTAAPHLCPDCIVSFEAPVGRLKCDTGVVLKPAAPTHIAINQAVAVWSPSLFQPRAPPLAV